MRVQADDRASNEEQRSRRRRPRGSNAPPASPNARGGCTVVGVIEDAGFSAKDKHDQQWALVHAIVDQYRWLVRR
jgi:hypothetical protein